MNRGTFYEEIFTAASRGGVLLTATRRLGRHLLARYGRWRSAQGDAAWLTPAIMTPDAWLERQLALLGEDWRLLGPAAARRIWEEVVEADAAARGLVLLQVPASAARAMEAHETLADFAVDADESLSGEDQRAFLRWRVAYLDRLQADHWIDAPAAWKRVEDGLRSGILSSPDPLLVVGFDDLSPRLQRLQRIVAERGAATAVLAAPTAPESVQQRLPCRDAATEVRCAARWARALLDAGSVHIGIVVPDLKSYRPLIERTFLAEIDPPALPAMSDEESRFGLSLGAPLAEQGPVTAALAVLACGSEPSLEQVGFLLRTPYLGGAEREQSERALFDRFLRGLHRDSFSLAALDDLARRYGPPVWSRLAAVLGARRPAGSRKGPAAWAEEFDQLLVDLGWPGERPLDSRDFQVVKAWRDKLLPGFAALDAVCRGLSRSEGVGLLRRLAAEMEFQVEKPDPGLQVCGILEAGGLDFDHLWVLGMHENGWPQAPRPNPFIPLEQQVRCGMPHADAGREADFAGRVTARLRAAAPRVMFSHPLQEGDCLLRPSPLIAALAPVSLEPLPVHDPVQVLAATGAPLGTVLDNQGPEPEGTDGVRGGVAILRDQALCPFRAFARHRLGARALDTAGPGLDPASRGTLAHAVLEGFWRQTRNHEQLQALTGAAREEAIVDCVAAAVEEFFARRPPRPAETLLAIERRRLELLLAEWLETIEDLRPGRAAEVLTEEECTGDFGGLRLRIRIDRIDALADGRRVLIDYKTGRVALDDLLGERLLEPQLPAYAVGLPDQGPVAVAIGELRRGECALKGVARDGDIFARGESFAGSRLAARHDLADWAALRERWDRQLHRLGADFCCGVADVDPVSLQKACRSCDLAGLCRIDEAGSRSSGEGENGP